LLPAGAFAGWDLHPLESAAFSRRTPETDVSMIQVMLFSILNGPSARAVM
jgi:hypothetical protein